MSTELQTLLFDRGLWSKAEAKEWAREQGFRYGKVDMKPNTFRLRQMDPGQVPESFHYYTLRAPKAGLPEGVSKVFVTDNFGGTGCAPQEFG